MNYPVSTYKIIAFPDYNVSADDCIDWAYEMLELGFDTPNLLILAAVSKPALYFDVELYIHATFKELGLSKVEEPDSLYAAIYYHADKITKGENVKSNLYAIFFRAGGEYEPYTMDFHRLYWAWDEFDWGETYQHYWDGATPANIEAITMQVAKNWIDKYRSVIESLL